MSLEFKDLKPNNLVYEGTSKYVRITSYYLYTWELNYSECSDYNPIPINEKTLSDIGLSSLSKKRNWYEFDNYDISVFSINTNGQCAIYTGKWINIRKLEYIHQLENLVYILFNKELKIKDEIKLN